MSIRHLAVSTLVFTAMSAAVALLLQQGRDAWQPIVAAVLVTPPVWRALARPRRGGIGRSTLVGALIGGLTQLLPGVVLLGWGHLTGTNRTRLEEGWDVLALMMFGFLACIAALPGCVCGALLAWHEARSKVEAA